MILITYAVKTNSLIKVVIITVYYYIISSVETNALVLLKIWIFSIVMFTKLQWKLFYFNKKIVIRK